MLYNRVRVILTEDHGKVFDRKYHESDPYIISLGGKYSGFISHLFTGNNPAHFYLINDPSDAIMAKLLLLQMKNSRVHLTREFKEAPFEIPYNMNTILEDIAAVVNEKDISSNRDARCWSGAKVMSLLINELV